MNRAQHGTGVDSQQEQQGPPPLPSMRTFVVKLKGAKDRVTEAHGFSWDENAVLSFYCYVPEPLPIGVMQKIHLTLQAHRWDEVEEQQEFARPTGPSSIIVN